MASKHDQTANRIAKQNRTDYNRGQGADVQAKSRAIEVETKDTISDGFRQLSGYKKPVFIAGADATATKAALEATKGTTVGVMDQNGKVVRRSTRGKN